jgi:hypothetical protein
MKAMIIGEMFFIGVVFGDPISLGPIPISGSGTYTWDYGGGPGETFSFSGSDGTDSISAGIFEGLDLEELTFPGLPDFLGPYPECGWSGLVTIDGITSTITPNFCPPPPNFTFGLGEDGGSVQIFEPTAISATVRGYIEYTNVTYTYYGDMLVEVDAPFIITPTPEPRTFIEVLMGLSFVATIARSGVH